MATLIPLKLSQLLTNSISTLRAGASLWTHKGHIQGLRMEFVAVDSVRVTSGSAWIESLGYAVSVPSTITKSSLSLDPTTWYHVYLFLNNNIPDIELSDTAPNTAYSGTARSKTGDTSRRYLGSVKTNGSGQIYNFAVVNGGQVLYKNQQDSTPFRALGGGTATTETAVSLSAVIPVTADAANLRLINAATSPSNAALYTGTSDDSAAGPPTSGIAAVGLGTSAFINHPVNPSQQVTYWYNVAPAGTGGLIDVYGYSYSR